MLLIRSWSAVSCAVPCLVAYVSSKSSVRLQGRFVEQLYGSGMVDETEKEALIAPIEKLERRLMRRGALGWRSPRVDEVRGCRSLGTVPLHALQTRPLAANSVEGCTRAVHSLLSLGGGLLRRLDEKSSGTQGEACLVFLADAVALQVTGD